MTVLAALAMTVQLVTNGHEVRSLPFLALYALTLALLSRKSRLPVAYGTELGMGSSLTAFIVWVLWISGCGFWCLAVSIHGVLAWGFVNLLLIPSAICGQFFLDRVGRNWREFTLSFVITFFISLTCMYLVVWDSTGRPPYFE